jgi:hypothetical protein
MGEGQIGRVYHTYYYYISFMRYKIKNTQYIENA